jgi:K+-transporting ATPase ATPase A chain
MSAVGWIQILVFLAIILAITKPLGAYMHRVFEGEQRPLPRTLGRVERGLEWLTGVRDAKEQTWKQYAASLLVFSLLGLIVSYLIMRLQHRLPLNPQGLGPVPPDGSFNTAVSFTTNTNWQWYSGESTMSYLSQMAALAWHNFTSAAAGIGVALALARGLTRKHGPEGPKTIGNFWRDLNRAIVYVLLPVSIVGALVFVAMGMIQNLDPYRTITTLEGTTQVIPMGPVASQEIIKQLGTNGGGFFNANAAHPFENPDGLSNLFSMLLIFAIPAGLTYLYGRMARDTKQGWAILGAMVILFAAGVGVAYPAEAAGNAALDGHPVAQPIGNMEGKEVRYGTSASALYAVITTDASCGAVNSMHDSYTPIGGMVPLVNMQLGEVVFGGVGAGLYGILVMVLLSVFIAGLMVGRTPEYLGKKVEARELKLAMLYVLVFPLTILVFAAWASVAGYGTSSLTNAGPHGLSEILYAYSSAAANNGSAFAGLAAGTPFYDTTLGLAMLFGRFLMIVPALAIGGAMVDKRITPPGPGTFPTNGLLFAVLLVAVIVIVSALTLLPALALGPVLEHFSARAGQVY